MQYIRTVPPTNYNFSLTILLPDVDECELPNKCFGNCTNLPGKYLCKCPGGTIGDPYTPNGCEKPHEKTGNNS